MFSIYSRFSSNRIVVRTWDTQTESYHEGNCVWPGSKEGGKRDEKIQPFPLPVKAKKAKSDRVFTPVRCPGVPPGSSGFLRVRRSRGLLITGGGSTPGGLSLFFDNNNFVVFAPLSRSLRFGNGDERIYFSQPQYLFSNIPNIIRGRGLGGGETVKKGLKKYVLY